MRPAMPLIAVPLEYTQGFGRLGGAGQVRRRRPFLDWDARTLQNLLVVRRQEVSRIDGTLAGKVSCDGIATRADTDGQDGLC